MMKLALAKAVPALAVVVAVALPCPAGGIRLDIAPAAMVSGPQVLLGDVAAVTCDDAQAAAKLRAIPVASAPMPGKSRPLDSQYIKVRLRQHGFDPQQVQAEWPDRVLVTTRCTVVSGADLAAAGEQALRAQLDPADAEIAITCSRTPSDMVLREGALELKAEPLGGFTGASRLVKVTACVNGEAQSSQTICYQVRRFAAAVVAGKQIERGQVITAEDVSTARCEVSATSAQPFADPAEVAGMRARRTLRAGEMITRAAVDEPPVIERGQKVWVTVLCGAIRIQAEAIAAEDAPANGTVRLKSASSGDSFTARVDGDGRVFVTP